ncbi:zinc dependent phospholipase C family protein [Candidatus Electronema sp. JM]|uniref:zinc dependent phospholipase C family protein n=1 Tax=Candidatus Electronema sp. JM TaxID=3401571 RepID=UPI003AA91012
MAGGYTHITLAQLAAEEIRRRPELLHEEHRLALSRWQKFLIIGAMGPDYPYLDIADSSSEAWAAAMHTSSCVAVIRECVRLIRPMSAPLLRQKCAAWLFGFASHCVTDGTVHPIVNKKVGAYEQHKTEHRCCEMSQDVLVHRKLNLGAIDLNGQLSLNVVETSDGSSLLLDRDIAAMWTAALNAVYRSGQPASFSLLDRFIRRVAGSMSGNQLLPPDPNEWHRAMRRNIKLAENGGRLMPFARHVAANAGLTYPAEPDPKYVLKLELPIQGSKMDFEEIFNKVLLHIANFWGHLSLALQGQPSPLDNMDGWSLDEGLDRNQRFVFWS